MSYEGYYEYLCVDGHYSTYDVSSKRPMHCHICKQPMEHVHGVDVTNGYDTKYPYSCNAPKERIGNDKYKPVKHWNKIHKQQELNLHE